MNDNGYFITFEGIDGVGKSTQIQAARALLKEHYDHGKVVVTKEPGDSAAGEMIREVVLAIDTTAMTAMTELLLLFADRAQHLKDVIRPALAENKLVLCDRFTDSSYAYQGTGRGLGRENIAILESMVQDKLRPDLTVLLDAPAEVALQRIKQPANLDRFEMEPDTFFEEVRQGYLAIAAAEPERVHVIDATAEQAAVTESLRQLLQQRGLIP
ncbi:MAG: dTMP kinase [Gammaproteobacteria bacterium]